MFTLFLLAANQYPSQIRKQNYILLLLVIIGFVSKSLAQDFSADRLIQLSRKDSLVKYKAICNSKTTIHGQRSDGKRFYIQLQFEQISDAHLSVYSVKGYYCFEKNAIHVPLVGIYDFNVGLTLYRFKTKKQQDQLLHFELSGTSNFWEELDQYDNLKGYTEKIIVRSKNDGVWLDAKHSYKTTLTTNKLDFYYTNEWLTYKNQRLNVSTLKLNVCDFTLLNYKIKNNDLKVLLAYSFASRSYALGMCGAGVESGFLMLHLDSNLHFKKKEIVALESCLYNISFEETPTHRPYLKQYKIAYDTGAITNEIETQVNLKTLTIIKKK